MIIPTTGWFEMRDIMSTNANAIANIVEQSSLTWYTRPTQVVFDRGKEFMSKFAETVQGDFGVTTIRNPRANGIIKRICQAIRIMVRTRQVESADTNESDP
jgi:hypothetical protein